MTDQPPFLNLAVRVRTPHDPRALLRLVKEIEQELGRRPTYRWGPRVVDVDIVLVEDEVVDLPDLTVPHPQMRNRAFVLIPLLELDADVTDPRTGDRLDGVLRKLPPAQVRRISHYE